MTEKYPWIETGQHKPVYLDWFIADLLFIDLMLELYYHQRDQLSQCALDLPGFKTESPTSRENFLVLDKTGQLGHPTSQSNTSP